MPINILTAPEAREPSQTGSPMLLTFEPPASTKWRVLQTNMPPFSTSFLQCRKAMLR